MGRAMRSWVYNLWHFAKVLRYWDSKQADSLTLSTWPSQVYMMVAFLYDQICLCLLETLGTPKKSRILVFALPFQLQVCIHNWKSNGDDHPLAYKATMIVLANAISLKVILTHGSNACARGVSCKGVVVAANVFLAHLSKGATAGSNPVGLPTKNQTSSQL